MMTGYLMSTADGRPIEVFNWFSLPALINDKEIHEWLAYVTMAVVTLHAAASLKHHFLDRSRVLARMWSGPANDR